ncbi:MAG: lipocalin family protein [Tannerellaceae bacterium]|jgi:hypothetical protein|nr:lipocalin family protein [Tannerellaceae bacterium]
MKNLLSLMSTVVLSGLLFTSCDKGDDEVNSKIVGIWKVTHAAGWYGAYGYEGDGKLEDFDWEANKEPEGEYSGFMEFKSDGTAWSYEGDSIEGWHKKSVTYTLKGSTLTLREEEDDEIYEIHEIYVHTRTVVSLTDNTLVLERRYDEEDGTPYEAYRDWYMKVSSLPDAVED